MCDIFSTTVIKVCTNLELKVNNKIQDEIRQGTPFSKTDMRTINAFVELLTRTRQKYILIRDNLTQHNP